MIICVAANPSIDKLFEVERLVPSGIHRPLAFVQTAGGKGLNVARAAHALGADVRVIGILRGHAGKWLEEAVRDEGIQGVFVWTEGETRSSLSVASLEAAGLTEFYEHGPAVGAAAWAEFGQVVTDMFEAGRWLTMSGSLPRGAPEDGYLQLVVPAREAGVQVALDADGEPLRRALSGGPDVVKVNAQEAANLLGGSSSGRDACLAAATELRERAGGAGHAGIVTRGADGVVVAAPDGSQYQGSLYEPGRYPVGSGDAFLAGLVVALDRGSDWPSALRLALGTATAQAEIPGAGKLDPRRAEELAHRAEIRAV